MDTSSPFRSWTSAKSGPVTSIRVSEDEPVLPIATERLASSPTSYRRTLEAVRGRSAVLDVRRRRSHSFSLVERLARLGCTRIGSPGILGERDPKALFKGAKPQMARERKLVGYRASSPPRRDRRLASHRRGTARFRPRE